MITPNKIEPEVVRILTPRIKDEYTAFYTYRQFSNWCKDEGFFKAAEYFNSESTDELTHVQRIQDYLVDWNVMPELPSFNAPQKPSSLISCIELAYKLEFDLYEKYEEDASKALKVCPDAFGFIQEYLEIQRKSVAEYSDKLNMLKGASTDKTSLLLLEDKLFG